MVLPVRLALRVPRVLLALLEIPAPLGLPARRVFRVFREKLARPAPQVRQVPLVLLVRLVLQVRKAFKAR